MKGLSFGPGPGSFRFTPQQAAPGPAAVGVQSFGDFAKVTQGHVEGSWMSLLHDWWQHHAYYPDQAAALGQDGTVELEIVVDKYGKVTGLRLLGRSGSQWLDMGAESVFRDARLPSLMPFTSDDQITVDLSIHYLLLR
jgi:protein TonB